MEPLECRAPFKPLTESDAGERYLAAKARLLAAQQEKMEAADEFLAARAALHGSLKTPQPTGIRAKEYSPSGCQAAWSGA